MLLIFIFIFKPLILFCSIAISFLLCLIAISFLLCSIANSFLQCSISISFLQCSIAISFLLCPSFLKFRTRNFVEQGILYFNGSYGPYEAFAFSHQYIFENWDISISIGESNTKNGFIFFNNGLIFVFGSTLFWYFQFNFQHNFIWKYKSHTSKIYWWIACGCRILDSSIRSCYLNSCTYKSKPKAS